MHRGRLLPFKVLAYLTVGESNAIASDPLTNQVSIQMVPFSRQLKLSSFDIRQSLKWLLANGFLTQLTLEQGKATLTVYCPSRLSKMSGEGGGQGYLSSSPQLQCGQNQGQSDQQVMDDENVYSTRVYIGC